MRQADTSENLKKKLKTCKWLISCCQQLEIPFLSSCCQQIS
jgi:hypothetical protein